MDILNNYWAAQTATFIIILVIAVFVSITRKNSNDLLPKETSNELRGLAILGVIFAHLTYGRFYDTQFLFPIGIWGGIAVDLFFLLSGYGLAASAIYHPKKIFEFYRKRLPKIYWPLWLSLAIFLIGDALILGIFYPTSEIISAVVGYFPRADLWQSINSPLWFLTLLLFYYVVFPLVFRSKHPLISTVAMFAVSCLVFLPGLPLSVQISKYYQLHFLAFPFGVLLATLIVSPAAVCKFCGRQDKCWVWRVAKQFKTWLKKTEKQKPLVVFFGWINNLALVWRIVLIVILMMVAAYFAYHSGVGRGWRAEQSLSLLVMFCLLAVFMIKKTKFRLLELIGVYSFEIYLLHWPLLGHYSFFYQFLPPAWGTVVYLILVVLLAIAFNYLTNLRLPKASK